MAKCEFSLSMAGYCDETSSRVLKIVRQWVDWEHMNCCGVCAVEKKPSTAAYRVCVAHYEAAKADLVSIYQFDAHVSVEGE